MDRILASSKFGLWLEENRQRNLRLVIIGAVFLLILGLAFKASQTHLRLLMVALVGIGVVLILLRWPPLGLAALIIGGLVVPVGLSTGTQSNLNPVVLILMFILGLWVFDRIAQKRRLLEFVSRSYLPLLVFSIVTILAFGMGRLPWFIYARSAPLRSQFVGMLIFLLSFGAYFLVGQQLRDLRWLKVLTWLFIFLGGIYVFGRFLPMVRPLTNRIYPHNGGGSLFWVWLAAMALSQAVVNRSLHLRWRLLAGAVAFLTIFTGFFIVRVWTSGWLPPMIALVVILWFVSPRLGLVVTFIGGFLMIIEVSTVTTVVLSGDNEYSLLTRVEAWRIILELIKVNPVLGLGPANYYFYTPLFPILGYAVSFNSHNNYVDIIAQTGLLGLICFLWFAVEAGWLGWRLNLRVTDDFARAYVYACLGGLAGTMAAAMLGDWVLPFVYNVGLNGLRASILAWLFLGGLVTLERIYLRPGTEAGRTV